MIISISSCFTFLNIFYSLFFNIYVLQNITTNLIYLLLYYLIGIVISTLLFWPFFKILNKKSAVWIFRGSFIFTFFVIILSMVLNSKFAFSLIFINGFKYIADMGFYIPSEIATMQNTNSGKVNKFLALKRILNIAIKVTCTMLISYLFVHVNILVLFSIMLAIVVAMFVLSFFIKDFGINDSFNQKEYLKAIKEHPYMKHIYWCHFFKNLGEGGVVGTLIPIMIFAKLGSGFSLGILSSVASIVTIISLTLLTRFYKNRHLPLIVIDILSIVFVVLLMIFSQPVFYILYFFINDIVLHSFSNAEISTLFDSVKMQGLKNYKKEHAYFYSSIGQIAEILSYVIGIITLLILPESIGIPLVILICMCLRLISIIYLKKCDHLFKEFKTTHPNELLEVPNDLMTNKI